MGHVTTATPTYGRFMVRTQEGYVFYVCTKFEVNNLIRFESYKGHPKISKLGHVTLSHAPFEL